MYSFNRHGRLGVKNYFHFTAADAIILILFLKVKDRRNGKECMIYTPTPLHILVVCLGLGVGGEITCLGIHTCTIKLIRSNTTQPIENPERVSGDRFQEHRPGAGRIMAVTAGRVPGPVAYVWLDTSLFTDVRAEEINLCNTHVCGKDSVTTGLC